MRRILQDMLIPLLLTVVLTAESTPVVGSLAPSVLPVGGSTQPAAVAPQPLAPLIAGDWKSLSMEETRRLLAAVQNTRAGADQTAGDKPRARDELAAATNPIGRALNLPFYVGARLIELDPAGDQGRSGLIILIESAQGLTRLDGTSQPIHALNKTLAIHLETETQAAAYLRLFCAAVQGEDGPFRLIEDPNDIPWRPDARNAERTAASAKVATLRMKRQEDGSWQTPGLVLYGPTLFGAELRIRPDGQVEMLDDTPIAADLNVAVERFVSDGFPIRRRYNDLQAAKAVIASATANKEGSSSATPQHNESHMAWLAAARELKTRNPVLFGGANGVLVTEVMPDTQGSSVHLSPGDILTWYGDKPLNSTEGLISLTEATKADQSIVMRFVRNGEGGQVVIQGGRIGVSIADMTEPLPQAATSPQRSVTPHQGPVFASQEDAQTASLAKESNRPITAEQRRLMLRQQALEYSTRGDTTQAETMLRQALDVSLNLEQPDLIAEDSLALGVLLEKAGKVEAAVSVLRAALDRDQSVYSDTDRGRINAYLGIYYQKMKQLRLAEAAFREALSAVKDDIKNRNIARIARLGLGQVLLKSGKADECADILRGGLLLFEPEDQSAGQSAGHAEMLLLLAKAEAMRGRLTEAKLALTASIKMLEAQGNPQRIGEGYLLLGSLAELDGNLAAAKKHLESARDLFSKAGDEAALARANFQLSLFNSVYLNSPGQHSAIQPEALGPDDLASAIVQGNEDGAQSSLQSLQSLGISPHDNDGNDGGVASLPGFIERMTRAYKLLNNGDYANALKECDEAQGDARKIGMPAGEYTVNMLRRQLLLALEERGPALHAAAEGVTLGYDSSVVLYQADSWRFLHKLFIDFGASNAAVFAGKFFANAIQLQRRQALTLDDRAQRELIHKAGPTYRSLIGVLTSQQRYAEASEALGLLKSTALYDYLGQPKGDDPREGLMAFTPSEQKVADAISRLAKQLHQDSDAARTRPQGKQNEASPDKETLAATEAQAATRASLTGLIESIESRLSASDGSKISGSKKLIERKLTKKRGWLARLSKRLGKKVALLQYVVLPNTVEVILTTSTGWHGTSAPTGPLLGSTLDMDISDMQAALRDPKSEASAAGQRLYRRLVAPVEAWLKAEKITAIVLDLDGQLQYLPFAAMYDGNRWLTERFILGRYSELSVAEQQENRTWKIAGFGVSKPFGDFAALPGVKAELEQIIQRDNADVVGIFPGTVHLDESFTEGQLFAEIETGASVLHIASHFRLSPGSDADSALLLGGGKMLSLRDIRSSGLDLKRVDLLVLSACETGRGSSEPNGFEIEGMGSIMQRQGAGSVIASLWPVADASTRELMGSFYQLLGDRPKLSKAEALHLAQLKLMGSNQAQTVATRGEVVRDFVVDGQVASPPGAAQVEGSNRDLTLNGYAHPYYWAPFILMGNWL